MPELTMRLGRTTVTFVITDDDSETTVLLAPEMEQGEVVRKLRRVLELVSPEDPKAAAVARLAAASLVPAPEPPATPSGAPANGWASLMGDSEPPVDLGTDYQLLPQEAE